MPRQKVAQRVYQRIREDIMSGRLPGGTRLKEVELAQQLDASRTPVREALVQLESEGLIVLLARRGAIVRMLGEKDVEDSFQLRALIEGFGAAQAAQRLTPKQIDELERLRAEMEGPQGQQQSPEAIAFLLEKNDRFHEIILEASGNSRLRSTLRAAMQIPRLYRTYHWSSMQERHRSFLYHRELVEAFRNRDPLWAEATMKSHIHAARDFLLATLRAERAAKDAVAAAAHPQRNGTREREGRTPRRSARARDPLWSEPGGPLDAIA